MTDEHPRPIDTLADEIAELTRRLACDAAERERTEQGLRDSERRLRQVIDLVPHFIFAKDADGRFVLVNQAVADAYGTTVENLLGKTDADFDPFPDEVEHFREDDLDVIRSGEPKHVPEERITDAQGRTRLLQTIKIPFTFSGTAQPAVLGVAIDITELRRAEAERRELEAHVQRAQKLESLGALAGGIAQDFNNLLVAILGNASLALDVVPADSPARAFLEQIEKAAHRAAELTNQMLAYSGRGRFAITRMDLSAQLDEMGQLLRTVVGKRIALTMELGRSLPGVEADPAQIRQVVMNLVTNACEAIGDREGAITIRTGVLEQGAAGPDGLEPGDLLPEGRYVCLEIADTGCGMDDDTRSKIFEPFFTTKFLGRGLGLAAVLGIVRGHGGALRVNSQPDRGATFQVLLPAVSAEGVSVR